MKAKATVEPSNILSFFEEFAENQRMPYVMLMVVYMLSTRRINLKANFLDHFYVEDDEKFASAIREMMKEVQDLLSPLSLGRKQIIENILAILLPGYEKENFLALSKQIFCAMGFPFLKNKAIKTIGKDNNFHEVLDSYTKDKKLNKEKHDKKNSRKEAKNTPFEVPNPVTPEPFKHHAPIEKIESQTIPDDTDEDGEVQANPTENKKLEAVVENEIPKIAVHGPLVHRKGSKQFRKVNTETDENQNENDMEEDNFEEDSDNNEAESDEVEDNE